MDGAESEKPATISSPKTAQAAGGDDLLAAIPGPAAGAEAPGRTNPEDSNKEEEVNAADSTGSSLTLADLPYDVVGTILEYYVWRAEDAATVAAVCMSWQQGTVCYEPLWRCCSEALAGQPSDESGVQVSGEYAQILRRAGVRDVLAERMRQLRRLSSGTFSTATSPAKSTPLTRLLRRSEEVDGVRGDPLSLSLEVAKLWGARAAIDPDVSLHLETNMADSLLQTSTSMAEAGRYLHDLKHLKLDFPLTTDEEVGALPLLANVRELAVTHFAAHGLPALAGMESLKELTLDESDEFLAASEGLAAIGSSSLASRLQRLTIRRGDREVCGVAAEGLAGLGRLRVLELDRCMRLATDDAVQCFPTSLVSLTMIGCCRELSAAGVRGIAQLTLLKELVMLEVDTQQHSARNPIIGPRPFEDMLSALTELRVFRLQSATSITDRVGQAIVSGDAAPRLEVLELVKHRLSHELQIALAARCTELILDGCRFN